jgi:hypothetical protein
MFSNVHTSFPVWPIFLKKKKKKYILLGVVFVCTVKVTTLARVPYAIRQAGRINNIERDLERSLLLHTHNSAAVFAPSICLCSTLARDGTPAAVHFDERY